MNESFFVKEQLKNKPPVGGALDVCLDTETVFRDVFRVFRGSDLLR